MSPSNIQFNGSNTSYAGSPKGKIGGGASVSPMPLAHTMFESMTELAELSGLDSGRVGFLVAAACPP